MSRTIMLGLATLIVGACADTGGASNFEANVREATRQALGQDLKDTFTVSDIKAEPMKVTWRVTAADQAFDCDADNKLALPSCRPAI